MKYNKRWGVIGIILLCMTAAPLFGQQAWQPAEPAREGFLTGVHGDFDAINFAYLRDYRSGTGQNFRNEWAQGFLLQLNSGYTQGPIGFGVDTLSMVDFKLNSRPSEAGTGILPTDKNGARDANGRVRLTGKIRFANTTLRIGDQVPKMLIVRASTSRTLPQTFQGGILESHDLPNLAVTVARYTNSWYRDGVGTVPITLTNKNQRFTGTPPADHLAMVALQYRLTPGMSLRYENGKLTSLYRQQALNFVSQTPLADGVLRSDLRYFLSKDVGRARAGLVDNRTFSGIVLYDIGPHQFAAAYQRVMGHTAMPWVGGTDANVANWTFINDFLERDERSWQARYAFDFKALGVPGLKILLRYVDADHAHPATRAGEGREWQRDLQVQYAFQSHALRHFLLVLTNSMLRSNFQRNADENRFIIEYNRPFHGSDT